MRRISKLLLVMLLLPSPAAAEVVDETASVVASAQLAQLTAISALLPIENRNAVAGATADLDGDSDLDIVVWHRLPEEAPFLFINDGQGDFTDEGGFRVPSLDSGETLTAFLVDLDGDGDIDAYVGRKPHDQVWLNDGLGVFTDASAIWLPEEWGGTTHGAVGDVTGDSRPDIILVQGGVVRVMENYYGTALRDITGEALLEPVEGITCVGLLDADASGTLDLITAAPSAIQLFLNMQTQFNPYYAQSNPNGAPIAGIAIADLEGDGDLDLIVAFEHYGLGLGTTGRVGKRMPRGAKKDKGGGLADETGVIGTYDSGELLIWRNQGDGSFGHQRAGVSATGSSNDIELADVDGDVLIDVVLPVTGANILILNPGTEPVWEGDTDWLLPDNEASRAAFTGDFNGDGLTDLYVANDGQDVLYLQREGSPQ